MINGIVIGLSALAGVWLGWYAVPMCIAILSVIKLIERNASPWIFVTCLVLVSLGAWRSETPPTESTTPDLGISTGAVGTIASFPIPSGDGHRALFNVSELCIADQCIPSTSRVLIYVNEQNPSLARGQNLRVDWRVQTLQELPAGYRNFVGSQNAEGSARITVVQTISSGPEFLQWLANANQRVSNNMAVLIPGDAGALGTGIVTGDDSGLSEQTKANFRATGTSHITAVSGQNVTLIIGFLSFWVHPGTARNRLLFHVFLIATVWSFTLFVGMEAPAMRAAIVATLSILGSHVGRKPDPVTLLSLTLGAIALVQPLSVYAVGFWLSAAASMALCLALPKTLKGSSRKITAELVRAPMVASVATMPISLMAFGVWSPVGILANILLAPIMVVAFPLTYAFALAAASAPDLAQHLSWVPAIPLEFGLVIVNRIAPVAMQWRIDTFSPALMIILWTPIAIGIWLLSNESQRWIRRVLSNHSSASASPDTLSTSNEVQARVP